MSFLPDAASNVFQPGWDISLGQYQRGTFHTAFGLGSPFPEDAKLCAALNSFWPAAAPDATRTFGLRGSPTAQPLLDVEIALHPRHPAVIGQGAVSRPGRDGEFGPFFEQVGGTLWVNYASKDRSDYVSNALANQIRLAALLEVDAEEMIRRMGTLRACVRVLPPQSDVVSTTPLFLVRAEKVDDWATRPDRGDAQLRGSGYLYERHQVGGNDGPGARHLLQFLDGLEFRCFGQGADLTIYRFKLFLQGQHRRSLRRTGARQQELPRLQLTKL